MQNDLGVRVVQKNLVYAIGIPSKYANSEILKKQDFFGQFGRIKKLCIKEGPSISAYITYEQEESAINCILSLDETYFDNKLIRVTFGTTKYCSFFLKNKECNNSECFYLHEIKEEIKKKVFKLHNFKPVNKGKRILGKDRVDLDELFKYKREEVVKKPSFNFSPFDINSK